MMCVYVMCVCVCVRDVRVCDVCIRDVCVCGVNVMHVSQTPNHARTHSMKQCSSALISTHTHTQHFTVSMN